MNLLFCALFNFRQKVQFWTDKNAPFLDMEKVILKNSCFLTTESRMGEMEAARPVKHYFVLFAFA